MMTIRFCTKIIGGGLAYVAGKLLIEEVYIDDDREGAVKVVLRLS